MKIAPEWLRTDALQFILGELSIGGHSAYCVGGCVRDAILGLPVSDMILSLSLRGWSMGHGRSWWARKASR